jgi:hypothetical protein
VAIDMGFLDGEDLWRLKYQRDIDFVIPAKTSMHIYKDAIDLASRAGQKDASEITTGRRTTKKVTGYGKQAKTEEFKTVVRGVPNVTTLDSYCDPSRAKEKNRKDFTPDALNAVVVQQWNGRTFKHPKVFLTSMSVSDPLVPFDRYDDRSLIENGVFREGKQHWSLEHAPQKSEAGVSVHVYLTMAAVALHRCYRLQTEPPREVKPLMPEKSDTPSASRPVVPQLLLGMERYRRELKAKNRNKVIIFLGSVYGILHVQEMALLSGINLRETSPGVGSREDVRKRFGLTQHNSTSGGDG